MARKNRRIREEYEPQTWDIQHLMTLSLPETPAVVLCVDETADAA